MLILSKLCNGSIILSRQNGDLSFALLHLNWDNGGYNSGATAHLKPGSYNEGFDDVFV